MSCPPFDLKDYFLRELSYAQQSQVEAHVKSCRLCREELDALRLTEAALLTVREEEIPRRIAFVSDKIFEPSPWRRAWAAFWGSGARLGFASACMVSAAILVSALTRPAPAPAIGVAPARVVSAALPDADIQARIQAAVDRAVAAGEAREEAKTQLLKADLETARQRLLWASDEFDLEQKRANRMRLSASNYVLPQAAPDNGASK